MPGWMVKTLNERGLSRIDAVMSGAESAPV